MSGPTSEAMRQAGVEDGLAGKKVVGNTDTYLAGYAEGELRRHIRTKYATITEEHLHHLCGQYNLKHEGLDHDQTLDLITDHLLRTSTSPDSSIRPPRHGGCAT